MIFYLLPILLAKDEEGKRNQKLLIIANEQDRKVFQQLMIIAFYSNLFRFWESYRKDIGERDFYISRAKLSKNEADRKTKNLFLKSVTSFKKNFAERIKFIFTPRFEPNEIERFMVNHKRLGFDNVFIDTLKAEIKGEYAMLSNLSQKLDKVAKENDLRIIATVQLAIHMRNRKYLDHTCIAESKQIVEIAENSVYFRDTTIDELSSLKIKHYQTVERNGKTENNIIELDKEDLESFSFNGFYKFMLIFIGKNRHGESNKVILAKYNMDKMLFQEIGLVENLKYDGY